VLDVETDRTAPVRSFAAGPGKDHDTVTPD
jgi:hypothetical protein